MRAMRGQFVYLPRGFEHELALNIPELTGSSGDVHHGISPVPPVPPPARRSAVWCRPVSPQRTRALLVRSLGYRPMAIEMCLLYV